MNFFRAAFFISILTYIGSPFGIANPIQIDFGSDTIHLCAWEPTEIIPYVSGGVQPYTYNWSTGDSTPTLELIAVAGAQILVLSITDSLLQQASDTVILHGFPECVWPGDANGDGLSNNLDLLFLGQAYGGVGIGRLNPHLNWIGQPAPSWGNVFSSGVNFVHADVNGDGGIDSLDRAGIVHNYLIPQQQAGLSPIAPAGIPFFFSPPTQNYLPGDTLTVPIHLGTQSQPADSIYGLAFSIFFDPAIIDSGSIILDVSNSWIGTDGVDMIHIQKEFFSHGQLDIAISRINHLPISGYGQFADITVVIDDLILKKEEIVIFGMESSGISVLDHEGRSFAISPIETQIPILLSNTLPYPSDRRLAISAFPNPVRDLLEVQVSGITGEARVQLSDQYGRDLRTKKVMREDTWKWSLADFPGGVYTLRAQSKGHYFSKKIIIQ
ncbi:MAG: T9SS type A sorting domain-containing protein [Bacteroidota bacterium]